MHTSSGVDVVDEFLETVEQKGGRPLLPLRQRAAAGRDEDGERRLPRGRRQHGQPQLRDLPHPSRPDRPRGGRQMGRLRDDAQAGRGASAELPAHQGARSRRLPEGGGAEGQFVEQHHLRRRRGEHRLPPSALHPGARRPLRLYASRSTAAIRAPTGAASTPCRRRRGCSTRRTAGSRTPTTGPIRRPGRTARSRAISRATWTRSARIRRGLAAVRVLREKRQLHPRGPARRRLRSLSAGLRRADPRPGRGLGRAQGRQPPEGEARRVRSPSCRRLGPSLGRGFGRDDPGDVLGRAALRGGAQGRAAARRDRVEHRQAAGRGAGSRRSAQAMDRLERRVRAVERARGARSTASSA